MTPAHSHADFELAQRHNLPLVHIFDDDGRLINVPQSFTVIFLRLIIIIIIFRFVSCRNVVTSEAATVTV